MSLLVPFSFFLQQLDTVDDTQRMTSKGSSIQLTKHARLCVTISLQSELIVSLPHLNNVFLHYDVIEKMAM
jgi:hypothetical protein